MDRAYSLLTVKAVEEGKRRITGVATTPEPDRVGDIVEPLGVKFKNPMPLLLFHQTDKPVGLVKFEKPTKDGINFEATIPAISEPGTLKDRVDEAWQSVKAGLIAGVSIGFRAIERSVLKDGGMRFIQTEVLELSLVVVPANAGATIQTVKSIDTDLRAASGHAQAAGDQVEQKPGASGKQEKANPRKGVSIMPKQTIAEQISAFEATRQAKAARMTELMETAAEKGETLDSEQAEEYAGLQVEVKSVDEHLVRLADLDKINRSAAKPITDVKDIKSGSEARGGAVPASAKLALPKGTVFTRYAMALAAGRGSRLEALEYAKRWDSTTPEVSLVIKAAMAAGTVTDADWAAPLVEYTNLASEFVELLRPETIIGRIPGLRRVPFNIKMPTQTQGATVGWVGELAPKPVSELKFGQITLGMYKAAGIIVLSEELVRSSNPSAEAIVRQDMIATIAQFLDQQFLDPDKSEVTNVSPASITNGLTAIPASGADADAVRADVMELFTGFMVQNLSLGGAVWIMSPTLALGLSMMMNPLGQPEFAGITPQGGTFMGFPVITSENMSTGMMVLLKASEILLADDGGVTLDVSREASIQMDSAPTNPPTASTVMVSLWQQNMVGLRAERFINWKRRRTGVVAYISNAGYGGAPGGSGT